ncbi:UPF0750 membrane protein YitT [Spirochaetia bacterium]|nr:UPF0750 membrane protein YitT [Spirochaetia bacterium]
MPNQSLRTTVKRLLLVTIGAFVMAVDLNTFVPAGGIIPGGFTGLTLLIQEVCLFYWNIQIPFSIILYTLNAVPAVICYRFIGKKFALYSGLMILLNGIMTDWMPAMLIELLQSHDVLLSAVFGGLLNAVAIAFCLHADATSGGTDFIAIFISERYRKDAWNYILAGNCVMLAVAALVFRSLDRALYSIIFQYTTTMALTSFYHGYQQKTLFIITNKPDEIYTLIRDTTNHDATSFKGIGHYKMAERVLLYSVVSANETASLVAEIKKVDPAAFINVFKTEQVNGRFYKRPKD